jgi:aryl-alcohol dehydrogenase-like predicted oxidoreductase
VQIPVARVPTEIPAGVPLARRALAWSLAHPAVAATIPGSKSIEQPSANVAAAALDLSPDPHPLSASA